MALDDATETTPPYLLHPEPLDLEAMPLQVHLLTGEILALRQQLARMARHYTGLAEDMTPAPPL